MLKINKFVPVLKTATQTRSIVRLLGKDKELSSFDKKDAPLPAVNPFNLPPTVNNAAGYKY
jgi:hypothetical protein